MRLKKKKSNFNTMNFTIRNSITNVDQFYF